jgi:hypothetical protein
MAECHQLVQGSTVISGHTRHHRLWPYETSLSLAIQDISLSECTRHLCLRLYKTSLSLTVQDISASGHTMPLPLRLRPVYVILPPLVIHHRARNKTRWKEWNRMILITASLTPCESEQGKSTAVAWGWPSIKKQKNPCAQKKSETTFNPTLNLTLNPPLLP